MIDIKAEYQKALIVVQAYEYKLGIHNGNGSIPFSEYHDFHKWMEKEEWYEAAEMEYDNHNDPSSVRLSIKELFIQYKENNNK